MHIPRLLLTPILFIAFVLLFQPSPLRAQVPAGTSFLVTLPAVMDYSERNDTTLKFRIEIYCSRTTKVSVQWANTGTYLIQDAQLNAGERIIVMKPMFNFNEIVQSDQRFLQDTVNMRAFLVTSDQPISVHATFDKNYRSEAYTVMPLSTYDTSYVGITYAGYGSQSGRGGFLIAAKENNTVVTITPGADVYRQLYTPKGTPLTVTLQKNQLYQLMANDQARGQLSDMTGTIINATKPIGVLSFSRSTNVPLTRPAADTPKIGDTPTPFPEASYTTKTLLNPQYSTSRAGTIFYALPFARQGRARIRLVATQFGTRFTMNGKPVTMVLGRTVRDSIFNTGMYFDTVITAPTIIESSKPVIGMQYAYSSTVTTFDSLVVREDQPNVTVQIPYGDPMMVMLPPINHYIRSAQWVTPSLDVRPAKTGNPPIVFFWEHYATIIAPVEAQGNVMLDGQPVDLNMTFPDGKYVGAIVRINTTAHKVESDYPINVVAHGFTWNDSYGMNAGESVRAIGKPNIDTLRFTTCEREFDTAFVLQNLGNADMRIDSIDASGIDVKILAPVKASLPQLIAAGSQQPIVFAMTLPSPGTYTGTLRIVTDANNKKIFEIPIIATRDSAQLVAPTTIDFGVIPSSETTHDTTVTIRNNGTKPIILTTADIVNAAFTVLSPTLPDTIAPGATQSLRIRITPGSQLREGSLTLRGNPCLTGLKIDLRGFQGGGASLLVQRSIDYPSFICDAPATVDSVLHIRSIGDEPVTINTWKINNDPNNEFSLLDDPVALSPILPGDTMHVRVRFSPKQPGLPRNASLDMTTTAVNARTLSIALRGALDTVFLQSSLSEIRFAQLRSCDGAIDTTITLTNGSRTIPDTITALNLGDNVTYTVTPSLPIIVYPGTPQTLRIRFAPQSDKTFPDTLRIVGSGCNSGATIILNGERVAPALTASAATLRFDTLYACDQKPIKRKIGLTNTGTTLTDTIVSATIAGNTAFTVTPLAAPIILLPGQTDSVEVTFTPNGGGDYIGALVLDWGPCAQTITVNVTGLVVEPTLEYSTTDLDFGKVDVGTGSRKSIVVANTGRVARTITSLDLGGAAGLRIVSPTLPVTIAAGDSATLEIEYAPTDTATLAATATITVEEPCPSEQRVSITGQGAAEEFIRASLTLAVPPVVTGVVDDTVDIAVSITQSALLAEAKPSKLRFVLRHNYTMLAPIKTGITTSVPGASVQVLRDEIIGSQRELEIELSGDAFPAQGEVARIPSLVLIGDAMQTPLELDTVSLTLQQANAIVSVKKESGEFQVQGVCVTGEGGRLIRLGGASLKTIRPNPFRGATAIDFEMMEAGAVEIVVLNMDGGEIAQVVKGEFGTGSYSVTFDGSSLASGLYFCELRSHGERMRHSLIIVE